MKMSKVWVAVALVVSILSPVAGLVGDLSMPQPTSAPTAPFPKGLRTAQNPAQFGLASITRADEWLNSQPLSAEALRGKIVLIDFWTYTCINWLRTAPYIRAWAEKYKDHGLVVISVHAPEFAFERNLDNVRRAVKQLDLRHPVAVDNDHTIWRAFDNNYWPALYFIDAQGRVRHHHFGEGAYEQSERMIQQLLAEAGAAIDRNLVSVDPRGFEVAADLATLRSPEKYLGYVRTDGFASPGEAVRNKPQLYAQPARLKLNEWALTGDWTIRDDAAVANGGKAVLATRFHARDVNLVMSPSVPVRFRVLLDGMPPSESLGLDVDEQGYGTVSEQRLYQLIRQTDQILDRKLEIEFFGPGVELFALTFG